MHTENRPFTIVYPLPVKIDSDKTQIELTSELKLVKYSVEELGHIWGIHIDTKVDGQQTTRQSVITNTEATFFNFIDGLGPLSTRAPQWEWWLVYSPDNDVFTGDTQVYAQACIKVCSELMVGFPFNFVYTARSSRWDFNSLPRDKITIMSFDYFDKLPSIKDLYSLKAIISKLDMDKLETAERLNFATVSLHRAFSADAYVSELVCILEKLYGSAQEASYKFRVHIFTSNSDLANKESWDLVHRAYKLRSSYLHGNKPTAKEKLTESEVRNLEILVSTLLQRYFALNLTDIKNSYDDDLLLARLKT